MKRIVCSAILCLLVLAAVAQNNQKVNAWLKDLSVAKTDTARAKIYNKLSVEYDDADSVKAYSYNRQAMDIFKKNNNEPGIANSYFVWGILLDNSNKKDSALLMYTKAADMAKKINDKNLLAAIYIDIGLLHNNNSNLPTAVEFYTRALTLSEETGNKGNMANAMRKLANLYMRQGDYRKALVQMKEVYNLYEQNKDSGTMAEALGSIGFTYRNLNVPDTAIIYFKKAIDLFNKINYKTFVPIAYTEIGKTYLDLKRYNDAIQNFMLALDMYKTIQYDKHQDALNIFIGTAYAELKQFDLAKKYIDTGFAMAVRTGDLEMQRDGKQALYNYYLKKGDYKSATNTFEEYDAIKDSIAAKQQLQAMSELNAKYESEKKEKRIQEQQFEITRRNYWIAGITAMVVLASALMYQLYRRYRLQQKARLQAEILRQQELASKAVIEAEENERSRISRDLHDGVGQMMSAARMNLSAMENNIYFETNEQKANFEKVKILIDESCNEVRAVSHNMMPNALLKMGLSSAVREFVDKIDSQVIKVVLHAEGLNERIDTNVETVLYRVIQECVNNVIKHAHATKLDISLIKDIDGISATIEDNGHGFDSTMINEFEGIGLKNIQSRVTYLKGTVEWDSAPGKGTVVAIHVPLSTAA